MKKITRHAHHGDPTGFPEGYTKPAKDNNEDTLEALLNSKHDSVDEMIVEALFEREDKEYYSELPEAKIDSEKLRNEDTFTGDDPKIWEEFVRIKKKEQKANTEFYKKKGRNPGGKGYVSAAYGQNDLHYIHYSEDELGIPGSTEKQLAKGRGSGMGNRPGYAQPQNVDTRQPKTTSEITQTPPPMMPEYTQWSKPKGAPQPNSLNIDNVYRMEGDSQVWPDSRGETMEGRLRDNAIPRVRVDKGVKKEAPPSQYSPKVSPKKNKR